jgi:hypothetical protein
MAGNLLPVQDRQIVLTPSLKWTREGVGELAVMVPNPIAEMPAARAETAVNGPPSGEILISQYSQHIPELPKESKALETSCSLILALEGGEMCPTSPWILSANHLCRPSK